jgi:iron complex outermembrane receptor protein
MAQTIVSGYDIDASARLTLPQDMGEVVLGLNSTTLTRRDSADMPGDPLQSDIGDEDTPKTRASLSAKWSRGPWRVSTTLNHVEPMRDTTLSSSSCAMYTKGGDADLCGIAQWQTLDVGFGYSGFKNIRLSLNIDNITDKRAPYDAVNTDTFSNQFHSMRGRYYSFSAKYSY